MKYMRRTESIGAARLVFKRARQDARPTYHVFVAAALMEYYCTKVLKLCFLLKYRCEQPKLVVARIEWHLRVRELSELRDQRAASWL